MAGQGFDEVVAVQNNSGHGVDLIGRNSTTGEVKVWEVKTTDGNSAPSLSRDQSKLGGEKFTKDRLDRASAGRGKVIPKKEHPIKNLIRRKKTESTKDTKSTNKSKIRSCFSCLSWTILLVDSLLEITLQHAQAIFEKNHPPL